ncbi:MAG: membrane dipeptidase [bacterium]|nr:membrane dipeptidase [bacterium]
MKRIIMLMMVLITLLLTFYGFAEQPVKELEAKAAAIHERVLTLDSHTDTPILMYYTKYDMGVSHAPETDGSRVDLPRMKKGGLDVAFLAVFQGQGKRTPQALQKAKENALIIYNLIHQAVKKNNTKAAIALTPDDAYALEKQGKRAIFIGMENGYPIGRDISLLKKFYDLGTKYITLCHSRNNDICDSSTDPKGPEHKGLSTFGKKVVKEMNRLGMMIDVSHISDKSFTDVLEISTVPVIASHSCARALCDHPRNLSDGMLRQLAKKGSVVQVCTVVDYLVPMPKLRAAYHAFETKYPDFWSMSGKEMTLAWNEWVATKKKLNVQPATVSDFVDHIDHIVKVAGIDHVGIGTDFDGGGYLKGCKDASQMGNITLELVKRGYTEEQIRKIWAGNFMRVFRQVEKAAGR